MIVCLVLMVICHVGDLGRASFSPAKIHVSSVNHAGNVKSHYSQWLLLHKKAAALPISTLDARRSAASGPWNGEHFRMGL